MEMEKLAQLFEAVKVLPLRPTDVVVLRTPCSINQGQAELIRELLKRAIGENKVLILDAGVDIEIVRPEPAACAD